MRKKIFLLLLILPFLIGSITSRLYADTPVKRVAIMEVVDRDGSLNYGLKLMIRSSLSVAVTQTPGYEGYDRVETSSIMDEQAFQRSGLVDDEQIKELGRIAGAAYILIADAAFVNDDNIVITAKLINVETGRLESTVSKTMAANVDRVNDVSQQLARELFRANRGEEKNATIEERTVVLYMEPGFEPSKSENYHRKITVYFDKKPVGKGSFNGGFDIELKNIDPGAHEVKFKLEGKGEDTKIAINTKRKRYYEFEMKENEGATFAYVFGSKNAYVYTITMKK